MDFDVSGLLSQAAQGKLPPAAALSDEGGMPTITVHAKAPTPITQDESIPQGEPPASPQAAQQPFDVSAMLAQAAQGKLKSPTVDTAGQSTFPGIGRQLWEGVKGGAVDLANMATTMPRAISGAGTMAYNALTGKDAQNPIPTMQLPEGPKPQGFAEQAAHAIGAGLPMLPVMGVAGGLRAMGAAVIPTIAGQVGGEAAAQSVPEPYQEAARFGGSLLGGGAGALGQESALAAGRAIAQPFGAAGIGPKINFQGEGGQVVRATQTQANQAAQQLQQAAESSGPGGGQRFQEALDRSGTPGPWGNTPEQIVPGSQPTTAQIAPLAGIAKLEDTVRARDGAPFLARGEQQNEARVGAIQGMQPVADPAAVGQFFRQRMADIDQLGEQATAMGQSAVQKGTQALGGTGTPEGYGQEMRGGVTAALQPVQQARRALWGAVDPDGTLAVDASPVRDAYNQLTRQLTTSDALTAGEVAAIKHAGEIGKINGAVPFTELQTLRSNVLSTTRKTKEGEALSTRGEYRMGVLKKAIDESFAQAVEQKAAAEGAGEAGAQPSMMDRLRAEQQAWNAGQGQAAAAAGRDIGAGAGGNAGAGAASVSGPRAAEGATARGPRNAPGSQGVPSGAQPLEPNFDQAAADRYAAAREATLREKERFGRGIVGKVLAGGKNGEPYAVPDASVPSSIFSGRPVEATQVRDFIKAVGGAPKAVAVARDYLVSDLRNRGIITPEGTLKPDQFARWQAQRAETTKLFPGLSDEFANVEKAQRTLDDVQAAHTAAVKEYQNGVAKHFLNEDPARAVEKTLNSADRVRQMNQIVGRVQGNPDALASLQAHVVDYMLDRLTTSAKASEKNAATPNISEIGSLRADAFKDWVGDNKPWLRRLFGGQGMQNLEMVGADLRRQQLRSIATAGSPTVERGIEAAKHGSIKQHVPTVLALIGEKIAETGASAVGLHGVGGLAAEALGAGLPVVAHMLRQRGIATVNDLVRETMLHPSVARELMARLGPNAKIGPLVQRRIAQSMAAVTAAESGTPQEKKQ